MTPKKLFSLVCVLVISVPLSATTITFSGKSHGEIIDNDYAGFGLNISATGGTGKAVIFNSELSSTIEDYDLLRLSGWSAGNLPSSTILGNILIVQDNQRPGVTGDIYNQPDDEVGSSLIFDFDFAIDSFGFDYVDIEQSELLKVKFFSGLTNVGTFNSSTISTGEIYGNNSLNRTDLQNLSGLGVNKVVIIMSGSGGVDNVRYNVPDVAMSWVLLSIGLACLAVGRSRFIGSNGNC